ncbi:unnamed protein product [Gongylonema pulchrum]|uniref:Uncharacterized protein n=1 Tax=Gongylonema pulchrum TaxID=637853 RepID=A0A183ENB8_9BILA|nr:unnamed protein product [Gongylonema pulchrum]
MLNVNSLQEDAKGVIARRAGASFATMRLKKLKLSGSMTENGDMDVAVSLGVFIMDDERRERTRVRRLLDKKTFIEYVRYR